MALSHHRDRDRDFLDLPLMHTGDFENKSLQQQRQQMAHLTLDVVAKEGQLLINAEAPGMKKEDLKINVDGDILTISGEKKASNYEQGDKFVRREISFGSVARSVRLPPDAQLDKISAKYDQGVLSVTVPRNETAKQARKDINID